MPQANTVGEFLKQQNIHLAIDPSDSLLSTSFAPFMEDDYLDLLTVLWMYSKKLLVPAKIPNPIPTIVSPSLEEVSEFYATVHTNISYSLIESATDAKQNPCPVEIPECPKPIWVTALQMTCWLYPKKVYQDLFKSNPIQKAEAAASITPSLSDKKPMPVVVFRALDDLRNARPREPKIQAPKPMRSASPLSSKTIHAKYMLNTLLSSLQVTVPEKLQPGLEQILQKDWRKVKGMTQEKVAELLYYILLFIFNFARANPNMSHFNYTDDELAMRLQKEALSRVPELRRALEQTTSSDPIDWAVFLKQHLIKSKLDMDCHLLALICFKNFPSLRALFINTWYESRYNTRATRNQEVVIHPSGNHFVLGATIGSVIEGEQFAINTNDFLILSELITRAKNKEAPSPAFFAAEKALEITHFEQLKAKIQNKAIQASLSSIEQIRLFEIKKVIKYSVALQFFLEHPIQSQNDTSPPHQLLHEFSTLFASQNNVSFYRFTKELINSKQTINLADTKNLIQQVTQVNQTLNLLDQFEYKEPTITQKNWITLQKEIWLQLQKALDNELKKLGINKDNSADLSSPSFLI